MNRMVDERLLTTNGYVGRVTGDGREREDLERRV